MGLEDLLSKFKEIKEEAEEKIQKFGELGDIFRESKEELGEIIGDGIKEIVVPSIKKPGIKKFRKKTGDFIRTVSDSKLKRGDVIGVHRGVYDHYGIYTGRGKVIHFSNEGSDFGGDIRVRRATLSQFKNGASNVFVVDFEAYRDYVENPELFDFGGLFKLALDSFFGNEITIYSPEETVERAESQLGKGEEREDKYNIIFNNCEHFAVWCKTGVKESSQVQRFIEAIGDPTVR